MASEDNIASKLLFFTFLLNISVGIVTMVVIDVDGNSVFGGSDVSWLPEYDGYKVNAFQEDLNTTINPNAGNLDDRGDEVYRVLDMFKIGFISKWLETVKVYMYGIVTLLQYMFGNFLADNVSEFLFGDPLGASWGLLHNLITALYIYSAWKMWSN